MNFNAFFLAVISAVINAHVSVISELFYVVRANHARHLPAIIIIFTQLNFASFDLGKKIESAFEI